MRLVVALLILVCVLAGASYAQGTPTRIGYFSKFEMINFTFAVQDDSGQLVWISPESTDLGCLGWWTIDQDPDNRFVFDTNNPGMYLMYAVVGMEHEGNWAGYGMGTQSRAIKGVRLDLKSDYNPEELTYQLWTHGLGLNPSPVITFRPALGFRHYELMFNGGNTIEWRVTAVTPPYSVMQSKIMQDGAKVNVFSGVVSAAYNGRFYLQQTEEPSGICVVWSGAVTEGSRVNVVGTLSTLNGERCITASAVTPVL